jgi:hypothetical protein
MVNRLDRRLEQLEQRMGVKPRRRLIYLGPNLEESDTEETPYRVQLSSEIWAHVFGAGFSNNEVEKLKQEFRNLNDPKI